MAINPLAQRVNGALADNKVTALELADITLAMRYATNVTPDDLAALSNLFVAQQGKMTLTAQFIARLTLQSMPANMRSKMSVASAAVDGVITQQEAQGIIDETRRAGLTQERYDGLMAAIKLYGDRFTPEAKNVFRAALSTLVCYPAYDIFER